MYRLTLVAVMAAPVFGQHTLVPNIQGNCDVAHQQIANYMKTQPYFMLDESTPVGATYRAKNADANGNEPSLVFEFTTVTPVIDRYALPLKSYPQEKRAQVAALRAKQAANTCRVHVTQKNTRDTSVGFCPVDDGTLPRYDPVLQACQDAHLDGQIQVRVAMRHIHEKGVVRAFTTLRMPGADPDKFITARPDP
jgi:hypothetical protein